MILFFRDKLKRPARPSFSRRELSLILGIYGARVQRGEWRDYAIDTLPDMAVFSVYRSAKEDPLYTIAKIPSRGLLKPPQFAVYAGNKTLSHGESLSAVLKIFDERESS